MFTDKVAIVTGSSMGIGKAIAHELGRRGAKVVLNGRNAIRLAETEAALKDEGFQVLAIAGDISKYEDCQQLIEATLAQFGRLDILINNAGAATRGEVAKMAPEVFRQVMEVNVLGSIYPTQLALPHLADSGGSVVMVSSIASFYGLPYNAIYCASKKALTAFVESLQLESKAKGIHVGIAYVGFTENDPKKIIFDSDGKRIYLDQRAGIRKQSPEQVANSVLRLIKRRKRSITLSVPGKALKVLTRLFPGLVHRIYAMNMGKIKAQSEGEPQYVHSETS